MMTREEFFANVKENIGRYLPDSYDHAEITLCTNIKNNDVEETGITIRTDGEAAVPVIYLDEYYPQYQDGKSMGDILSEIRDVRVQLEDMPKPAIDAAGILDYENVKGNLQMRVFDTERNEKKLESIVHHSFGDYSSAYAILVGSDKEQDMSVMVTPDMMEHWGITKRQLHEDTIQADMEREPVLMDMASTLSSFLGGTEPVNFLKEPIPEEIFFGEGGTTPPFFCLTNQARVNGAGLILNPKIQEKLASELGSYYVLPSSVHEVLILADIGNRELYNARDLGRMVKSINETEVSPKDVLSDKVQYYDAGSRTLMNAAEFEKREELGIDLMRERTI